VKPTPSFLQDLRLRGNIYWALIQYMALVMAVFTLCRIGFYFFNREFFPEITTTSLLPLMVAGLKFDISAILYTNLLFILLLSLPFKARFHPAYQATLKWIFIVTNSIALVANVGDFIYFKFTLRRTTFDVFEQFGNEGNMGVLFGRFLFDYWYAVLFWAVCVAILVYGYKKIGVAGPMIRNKIAYYVSGVLAMPVIVFFFLGGVKGGLWTDHRPLTLSDAGEYVNDPKDISLVLNTPFCIYRTTGKTQIKKVKYFTDETALDAIYTPLHKPHESESFRKENVVVIILESFSKEFFKTFNPDLEGGNYEGYTPFLDSLIQHSKTFQYSFANGRKSIDALPSVISSIPNMGIQYVLSPFSGNKINSLASLLKDKGYHSAFFHGAPNGSMGFESFMRMAGIDEYYGMTEYNNDADYDGWWGIWDHKFLPYTADKLSEFKEPFVSVTFSLSSHHPFSVPKEYQERFKGGPVKLQRCIQYADFSLSQFFKKASKMPWYNNTLFVITADHTSLSQFPEYKSNSGLYAVPILFFKPDHSLKGMETQIVHQADVMPTILDYLNYDKEFIAFGRSAFDTEIPHFAFNAKDNTYQLFEDDYLLIFGGKKTLGLYEFKKDRMCKHNVMKENAEVVQRLEQRIKAIIQQYNNRMIENRLIISNPQVIALKGQGEK
jgi:phosphoglycerol transferase MdoB-like AlkP superfamily enzyme